MTRVHNPWVIWVNIFLFRFHFPGFRNFLLASLLIDWFDFRPAMFYSTHIIRCFGFWTSDFEQLPLWQLLTLLVLISTRWSCKCHWKPNRANLTTQSSIQLMLCVSSDWAYLPWVTILMQCAAQTLLLTSMMMMIWYGPLVVCPSQFWPTWNGSRRVLVLCWVYASDQHHVRIRPHGHVCCEREACLAPGIACCTSPWALLDIGFAVLSWVPSTRGLSHCISSLHPDDCLVWLYQALGTCSELCGKWTGCTGSSVSLCIVIAITWSFRLFSSWGQPCNFWMALRGCLSASRSFRWEGLSFALFFLCAAIVGFLGTTATSSPPTSLSSASTDLKWVLFKSCQARFFSPLKGWGIVVVILLLKLSFQDSPEEGVGVLEVFVLQLV